MPPLRRKCACTGRLAQGGVAGGRPSSLCTAQAHRGNSHAVTSVNSCLRVQTGTLLRTCSPYAHSSFTRLVAQRLQAVRREDVSVQSMQSFGMPRAVELLMATAQRAQCLRCR